MPTVDLPSERGWHATPLLDPRPPIVEEADHVAAGLLDPNTVYAKLLNAAGLLTLDGSSRKLASGR